MNDVYLYEPRVHVVVYQVVSYYVTRDVRFFDVAARLLSRDGPIAELFGGLVLV